MFAKESSHPPAIRQRRDRVNCQQVLPISNRSQHAGVVRVACLAAVALVLLLSLSGCQKLSWTPTTVTGAPGPRYDHTAVWTGTEMIVWGGFNFSVNMDDGGHYDPGTDSWTPTGSAQQWLQRSSHTAVWTGSEMIVWGGENWEIGGTLGDGARYDPGTGSWVAIDTSTAPEGRYDHTAVWTGSEMIVWGGEGWTSYLNDGGRYMKAASAQTGALTQSVHLTLKKRTLSGVVRLINVFDILCY